MYTNATYFDTYLIDSRVTRNITRNILLGFNDQKEEKIKLKGLNE